MDEGQVQFKGGWKRAQAAFLTILVRLLRSTWRVRVHDDFILKNAIDNGGAVIAFWHGEQLPMIPLHGSRQIVGLASNSADGMLVADILNRLGYGVVRGSSSNGGLSALHACRRSLRKGISPALAVDGPRGPRHKVQLGALGISAHAGAPIVYAVSHVSKVWELSSWDRFQIPWPWSKIQVAYGLMNPPQSDKPALESGAVELRKRMLELKQTLRAFESAPLDA